MSATSSFFANRTAVIATMHRKEQAIAPLIETALEVKTLVPSHFDTDKLGTFTRDIQRPADQLTTARLKARAALELTGETLAIASEGSFGPHPQIPFVGCDREIVLLLDSQHQLEIVGETLSTQTNHQGQTIRSVQAALDFAQQVGFPEHGLIVMESEQRFEPGKSVKGITTESDLIAAVEATLERSPDGQVHIETDMRALYNPTRMRAIAEATAALIKQIGQHCPECGYPGFSLVQRLPGLPCNLCGAATLLTLTNIYGCQHCQFQQNQRFPEGTRAADPAYCPFCNP